MKVTIKDIAREAGVSITAVSLVLNNRPSRIPEETKDKIRKVAEKYNYTPNIVAKSLVTQETKTIGLIIPDIENSFFSGLAKSVEEFARTEGYLVLIMNNHDNHQSNIEVINLLSKRNIDGLLMVLPNEAYQDNYLQETMALLEKLKFPFVLVDRVVDHLNVNKAHYDNKQGGYLACKHLLEMGHTKIACITGPKHVRSTQDRLEGVLEALREHQLTIEPQFIIEGDYYFDSGYNGMNKLLNKDITAVFVFNDMMAFGATRALLETDQSVPNDLSIVSYDYSYIMKMLRYQLDSIKQDNMELGEAACSILFESLKDPKTEIKEIQLQPQLVVKGSVKKLS